MNGFLDVIFVSIFALVAIFVQLLIHETGHLIGGLCSGYKFRLFRIFSFLWLNVNGKITFRVSGAGLRLIAGQCLMFPPDDGRKLKYKLYFLAGGYLNILTGTIAAIVFFAYGMIYDPVSMGPMAYGMLFSTMVLGIGFGIGNIIPRDRGIPNDGLNAKLLDKSELARKCFITVLKVDAELDAGKRLRDYPAGYFDVPEDADISDPFIVSCIIYKCGRLDDLGKRDEAFSIFQNLDIDKVRPYYRNAILIEELYYYLLFSKDADAVEKAMKIYDNKGVKKMFRLRLPGMSKVMAAIKYFIDEDKVMSAKYLKQARAELKHLHGGKRALEEEDLDYLEKIL